MALSYRANLGQTTRHPTPASWPGRKHRVLVVASATGALPMGSIDDTYDLDMHLPTDCQELRPLCCCANWLHCWPRTSTRFRVSVGHHAACCSQNYRASVALCQHEVSTPNPPRFYISAQRQLQTPRTWRSCESSPNNMLKGRTARFGYMATLRTQTTHTTCVICRTGTYFCSDKSVTAVVIQGLAAHKDSLGAPLCPCRHYDDKEAEAAQGFWNCPCVPMRERKVRILCSTMATNSQYSGR